MTNAEFAQFYEETAHDLYAFASLIAGDDDGEDLAAEAYARTLARWREVRGYERPDAWVRRVIINLLISRRRKERVQLLFHQGTSHASEPLSPTDQSEDRILIQAALNRLPPRQRAVIILRYFNDLSLKETAQAIRCSVSTANTHLRRGQSRLRSLLGEAYLSVGPTASIIDNRRHGAESMSSPPPEHLTPPRR